MIKVLINGVACPTVENDSILVNKQITDIENPEAKTADWTQSFLIQNTSKVAILFGQIFQVNLDIQNVASTNFTPDFNPNLKAAIVVLNENTVAFTGFCQMQDIIIYRKSQVRYSINAYATIGNFFNDIRNSFISDLDFSMYNHDWTRANVVASWTPTLGQGYVYPMIDYGYGTQYERWLVTYFRPALFAKEIIDKIFTAAGWSYTSAFLTSTRFKSLIDPFCGEQLFIDADTLVDRSFLVGRDDSILTQALVTWFDRTNPSPVVFNLDTGPLAGYALHNTLTGAYTAGDGKWLCTDNGNYKFGFSMSARMVNAIAGVTAVVGFANLGLFKDDGVNVTVVEGYPFIFGFSGSATSNTITASFTTSTIHAVTGDIFYWAFYLGEIRDAYLIYHHSSGADISIETDIGSVSSLIPQPELSYGDLIMMDNCVPENIAQKDYIMSIAKMFNLYFEQTGSKTLLIEPRDDYYLSTTVDWTTKIDVGQDVKLIPMGMNNQKRYKFTYDEDGDYMNKKYFESYRRIYGDHIQEVTNDFLTQTKEIKPIFAATVLSNSMSGDNDRIVSDMRFANEDGSDVKPGQSKLRILYWGGLIDCNKWNLRNEVTTPLDVADDLTQYPYAGHLDNPYAPTFDLSFGTPLNVYYDNNIGGAGNVTYTDNNLYSAYWDQVIRQLTNKNSKVLDAMFRLNITDFINIDFRKLYFIKEAYYRLLEVIDYDITGLYLVRCRLLKVDKITAYVSSSKSVTGGTATFDAGGKVPTRGPVVSKDARVQRVDKQFEGYGGYVTGENTMNKGNSNFIPHSASDSYILGSNDTQVTQPRSFVFNSDSTEVVRAGAMFNGVDLERKFEFTADQAFMMSVDSSTPFEILPPVRANEKYLITGFYAQIGAGTVNYTSAGNILLNIGGNTRATIASAAWTGLGEGAYASSNAEPSYNNTLVTGVTIQVSNLITAGDRNIRFVIIYKIITI